MHLNFKTTGDFIANGSRLLRDLPCLDLNKLLVKM